MINKGIFVVIPVFNEEKTIGEVIEGVRKYCQEIIVVDDGSTDDTYRIVKKKKVAVLRNILNLGKGASLKEGFNFGFSKGGKVGIMMDGDGQHDYRDLPLFIKKIGEGEKLVLGYRHFSKKDPLVRRWFNKLATFLISMLYGNKFYDLTCGYRAIAKEVYEKIKWRSGGYGVETEMNIRIAKNKLKYSQIPIKTIYLDDYKGVTVYDALRILVNVIFWRFVRI